MIAFASLLIVFSIQAKTIQMNGKDGFKIYGDYTVAQNTTSNDSSEGVLMLHQCNADRSMYQGLAKSLAAKGISSMSLDFRGYGDSVVDGNSIAAIRKKATSRQDFADRMKQAGIGMHRVDDVEIAYQYLIGKLGDNAEVSLIGASCGGAQAINLAEKHHVNSFVFFSSGMNKEYIKKFNELSDIPALIIAAQEDEYTYKSSKHIFEAAKSNQSRLVLYKGSGHGRPLFKQDPNLENTMVNWFELNFQ